jgi:hypothetical protein
MNIVVLIVIEGACAVGLVAIVLAVLVGETL